MSGKWWAYIDYPSYISHLSVRRGDDGEPISQCGLVELDNETRWERKTDKRCIICAGRLK